jgi:hypothetical protein
MTVGADEDSLRQLVDLMSLADERARATVEPIELPEHGQRIVLGLFVATWEVFRGIRALVAQLLAEEALMLSRTLLEDTARLIWLSQSPGELEGRAIRFSLASERYARDVAQTARANGWEWADDMLTDRAREIASLKKAAEEAGLGSEPLPFPKTSELLDELDDSRLAYWYARASQSVHSTTIGISARIEAADSAEGSNQIRLRGSIKETARIGLMAAQFFMISLHAASVILPWGGSDEILAFAEEAVARNKAFFSRLTPHRDEGT